MLGRFQGVVPDLAVRGESLRGYAEERGLEGVSDGVPVPGEGGLPAYEGLFGRPGERFFQRPEVGGSVARVVDGDEHDLVFR